MTEVYIRCINRMEQWSGLASEWNALLESSANPTIFQTWEWLLSWAECCLVESRRLFLLTLYKRRQLFGIAPFYIERKKIGPFNLRELRFLGSFEAGSDYLDVIAEKGKEREAANAIYDYLMHGNGKKYWDQMALTDIPADSIFLSSFHLRLQAEGKYAELTKNAFCPVMDIPADETAFFAGLSKTWRKKVKQDLRVVSREKSVRHEIVQGKEVVERLADFFSFYESMTGRQGKRLQTILKQVIAKRPDEPPMQIDLLFINAKLVAGLLHFKFHRTLAMYLMAVDKNYNPKVSLGNLLIGESIKHAIESGYSYYDFLKGEECYKFHWASRGYCTIQYNVWQKRPAAIISAFLRLSRHAGKLFLR